MLLRLDSSNTLKVVEVYPLTTTSDDEQVEGFYNEVESTLIVRSICTVVMGDFNAKLGRKEKTEERYTLVGTA